jgi:hypothetical protein
MEREGQWLNISSFSVKELVKNVHYFSYFFFTEKASEKLKSFQHFLACFKFIILHVKTKKSGEIFQLCFQ